MNAIKELEKVTFPTWPLQNTVATHPFWEMIDRPFAEIMTKMSALTGEMLYMPISYYLQKLNEGEILPEDVEYALRKEKWRLDVDNFLGIKSSTELKFNGPKTFCEFIDEAKGYHWKDFVICELSRYAAAYFDEKQALAKFPWQSQRFYSAWFEAQKFDRSFQIAGLKTFSQTINRFEKLSAEEAVLEVARRLDLPSENDLSEYVGRLSSLMLGWASQFRFHEWQKDLGYPPHRQDQIFTIDLVAVLMICDYALVEDLKSRRANLVSEWKHNFSNRRIKAVHELQQRHIWQSAFERSRQREIIRQIKPAGVEKVAAKIQFASCIDVRSEPFRRNLEKASDQIETIGFAGFYGLPFEYKKIDELQPGRRLPVLLKSAFKIEEVTSKADQKVIRTLVASYFRNLRKAPLSSFLFVELFGLLAIFKLCSQFTNSLAALTARGDFSRFSESRNCLKPQLVVEETEREMPAVSQVERAERLLTHMGIKNNLARLVVIAGHGSQNTNNAFNSASDCGACGGHPGDINAKIATMLLNDPELRKCLKERGIFIPETTWFLPALHETVTDELILYYEEDVPATHESELKYLKAAIEEATRQTRSERLKARSSRPSASPSHRVQSWSETRPEWALAGNSCFIIAPRQMTKAANLNGRAFLHDYDFTTDHNFSTLEQIMTAPMIVTSWINTQYYASTVAPGTYGAGNKVLHNLINETGVIEGNGGDLRVGLPWQSVHDGERFTHDPVRLSVYIAAPSSAIQKIIEKHSKVRKLIENEWILLNLVETETGLTKPWPCL